MPYDVNQSSPLDDREDWIRPVVRRMDAGSAELELNGADDGPNQVS
jgi:hypothetical protein